MTNKEKARRLKILWHYWLLYPDTFTFKDEKAFNSRSIFQELKYLFIYFERQRRVRNFPIGWCTPPVDCESWGWTRLQLETMDSIKVSHGVTGIQVLESSPPRVCSNRKLELKIELDSNLGTPAVWWRHLQQQHPNTTSKKSNARVAFEYTSLLRTTKFILGQKYYFVLRIECSQNLVFKAFHSSSWQAPCLLASSVVGTVTTNLGKNDSCPQVAH